MLEIGTALAQEGQASEAQAVIREAQGLARGVQDVDARHVLLGMVAGALARAGQLRQALEEVENIDDLGRRDIAFLGIIDALENQGRFQSALEVVDRIKDWSTVGQEHLLGTASILAEAGNYSQAKAVIRKAHEVTRGYQDANSRDAALIDVAVAFALMGSTEEAIAVVREIHEEATRVHGLSEIVMRISSPAACPGKLGRGLRL